MTGAAACLGGGGGGGGSPLTVSIVGGTYVAAYGSSYTFPTNTVTVVGGTGPFTYLWGETDDGGGTWSSGGTTASYAPAVSRVKSGGNYSSASYTCTVTDSLGNKGVSNIAVYTYFNLNGAFS